MEKRTHKADISRFLGTWKLISCEHRLENGTITYPMGDNPVGVLIYTPDGYMSGTLMNANRPRFRTTDLFEGSDSERAQAARTYVHYTGPFEVWEDRVIHHVEASLFPNWVGTRQQRFYQFSGDTLELSTNPFVSEGGRQTAHLLWKRVQG